MLQDMGIKSQWVDTERFGEIQSYLYKENIKVWDEREIQHQGKLWRPVFK